MTNSEFINEFDILYNSICSNQAPSLDTYEKSVILTLAQEDLVREWYSGNVTFFEKTEELRRALDGIVKFITINPSEQKSLLGGIVYKLPEDLWFITYETVKAHNEDNSCIDNKDLDVIPVTQDEFNKAKNNPFRGPNNRQVLRLDTGPSEVTLINPNTLGEYTIGYVSRLEPIILEDLDDGLKINGKDKECECKLNSATHRLILKRGTEIAKSIYLSNTQQ